MGAPMELHLARHGAVAEPWPSRLYGALDVPLSELGRAQSQALAESLAGRPLAAVVSSGLARADHAADLVHAALPSAARRVDPRLRELARGDWAGLDRAAVEARCPGGWERFWQAGGIEPPPGGERLADLQARVLAALDDLARAYAGAEVLVVAHKWVVRAALCQVLELPLERAAALLVPPCGRARLAWPDAAGTPRLLALVPPA